MKRFPVDIIIPDTGPLITLAASDRLDLLQTFGRQIFITDIVQRECTVKTDAPGSAELSDWIASKGHNQFHTIETPFAETWDKLRAIPVPPGSKPPTKGFGEVSIAWTIANIERFASPKSVTLVLIEDGRAGDSMPEGVHILSTRAWLRTLVNIGLLKEHASISNNRLRIVSKYLRDKPVSFAAGKRSDWTEQTRQQYRLAEKDKKPSPQRQGSQPRKSRRRDDDKGPGL